MTPKIAVTGLSGTIGKRLLGQLPPQSYIYDLYHHHPTQLSRGQDLIHAQMDLLDKDSIRSVLQQVKPDVILHMAAMTHIDRCEEDRIKGKDGDVWKVNVGSMDPIIEYAAAHQAYLIFLSTECVFGGEKKSYHEGDAKYPINWYGITKSKAEDMLVQSGISASILRGVIAYHEQDQGTTIFGKILAQLEKNQPFQSVNDQHITPTYTDDIVKGIIELVSQRHEGIFHVAPQQDTTPFLFGKEIAKHFNFDPDLIAGISMDEFFGESRSRLRAKHAALDSARTRNILKFTPRTIGEVLGGLQTFKIPQVATL